MDAPLLIIEAGRPALPLRRHGSFPHWIRVAAGLPAEAVVVAPVMHGTPLPRRDGFAGVIVSGSAAMVTQRHDWSEGTAQWLCEAAQAGMPLLGLCYGHQLIAHALGGEVDDNPAGREMGTVEIALTPEAADDPLFRSMPPRFRVQTTHRQSVLRLPEGARLLATSSQDPCHAFRWGEHVWGLQFHPEFSTMHMRGYLGARAEVLRREGRCPVEAAGSVRAAPRARALLRRFVHHARALVA